MTEQVPHEAPEFWAGQAQELANDLTRVEEAIDALRKHLPRAINQAADLGLMREQHDAATIRTVVRGEQELAMSREASLARLEGRIALVEDRIGTVERLLHEIIDMMSQRETATTTRPEGA